MVFENFQILRLSLSLFFMLSSKKKKNHISILYIREYFQTDTKSLRFFFRHQGVDYVISFLLPLLPFFTSTLTIPLPLFDFYESGNRIVKVKWWSGSRIIKVKMKGSKMVKVKLWNWNNEGDLVEWYGSENGLVKAEIKG